MTTELPRALREELSAPIKALNDTLHELTSSLKDMHRDRAQTTATLDDLMSRLTDRLAELRISSNSAHLQGRRFWPRRSTTSKQEPTV